MNMIVISPRVSITSAKALAVALGVRHNNPYDTEKRNFLDYDVVINYGCTVPFHAKQVVNRPSRISKSIDKVETLSLLDREQTCTVPFTLNRKQALEWLKEDGVVVVRQTAEGSNSDGVLYCQDVEEFNKTVAVFWTRFVEHTHEFRVNCWKDTVVSIYNKETTENKKKEQEFQFKLYQGQEKHPQLVEIVKHVHQKIGLDWYGIDVLRTKKGDLCVLEVNSAPILFPFTIEKLVKILNKEYAND